MLHSRSDLTGQDPSRREGLAGFFFANSARGLLIVAVLFFCAGALALGGAYTAYGEARAVKEKHMPLMEAALTLEGRVYETIFHASIFGSTGDAASYSGSRIRFAGIRESAEAVTKLASYTSRGGETRLKIGRDMELLGDMAQRLDLVVEKQRTLIDSLESEREKLRKSADELGEMLLSLQARTASGSAASPAVSGGKPNIELDEKARLLALNGFALAVEAVTNQAAAGLSKSAHELAVAEGVFGKRWQEAREACRLAGPDVFARMETSVAVYREIMGLLRFNLEEVERLGLGREDIIGRLAAATRGIVVLARDAASETVVRAEKALFTALVFGGALFAVALAVGAGIFFGRRQSPVTNTVI